MYGTYLRRELSGRTKQTVIVAVGLAIAIALVIVVNALSVGVKDAQATALESVYGVGTDITVTGEAQQPGQGGGGNFSFGSGDNPGQQTQNSDGSTTLSQSRLTTGRMRQTIAASTVATVAGVSGVSAATGTLALENMTFSGEIPQRGSESGSQSGSASGSGSTGQQAPGGSGSGEGSGGGPAGGSFGVNSISVLGVDPAVTGVGPLSSVTISDGRALEASDAGQDNAVVDSAYATTNSLAVGGTLELGGTTFQIAGIATSATSDADTASNVYIPLDVAQTLSGAGDVVSTVYVTASSASSIDQIKADIQSAVPDSTVNTQADLASTVSGSLSSATGLITNLGTWLSIIVLVVAVAIAVLLTMSGVARRTREFGTLKAIGWTDRRIVGQVAGESVVQALIGGIAGIVIGVGAILVINVIAPTISATASSGRGGGMPGGSGGAPGGGAGGGGGFGGGVAQATQEIVLHAPLTIGIILAAVGLAAAGGLIAGAFGGWRASRLSPAEALRSVA